MYQNIQDAAKSNAIRKFLLLEVYVMKEEPKFPPKQDRQGKN